tara:strand:- start:1053 stop:1286 length:234 start_codon:yes stop_codon:yes gene_type:complete
MQWEKEKSKLWSLVVILMQILTKENKMDLTTEVKLAYKRGELLGIKTAQAELALIENQILQEINKLEELNETQAQSK